MKLVVAFFVSMIVLGTGIAFGAQNDIEGWASEPPDDRLVELIDKRTATSKTFQLPDGSRETRIFTSPINYRDAEGKWQPIETGLEEVGEAGAEEAAFANGDNSFDLSLPESLGEEPVQISTGEDWVAAELIGSATEDAQLEDGTVSYESTDGGTNFEFIGLPDGLKENIELEDPSQSSTFAYDLAASTGLSAQLVEDGSIELRDDEGKAAFLLPAPTMYDSSGMAPASAIHYELEARGEGHWRLTVAADREWLERPDRSWPVTIDPTITTVGPSLDCTYTGAAKSEGTSFCASSGWPYLAAKYSFGASEEWNRTALRFDLSWIPKEASVSSATAGLYSPFAAQQTSGVELRRAASPWTSALNWTHNTASSLWNTPGGDFGTAGAEVLTAQRGGKAGWWYFSEGLVPLISEWVALPPLNNGFLLRLLDDQSKECSCTERSVIFNSSASAAEVRPYLSVTYYSQASSDSVVTSPRQGTRTARRAKLTSAWKHAGVTGVTFQYKHGVWGWTDIPPSSVTDEEGQSVSWPLVTEGEEESEPVFWDIPSTSEALTKSADLQVRAILVGAKGADGYTQPVELNLDREVGGTKDAVAGVGPGAVDLLTGNFTVGRTDVSIPGFGSALEFSRTHSSRSVGSAFGVLGGWEPGVPVEAAGGAEWRSVRTETAIVEEEDAEGNVKTIPIGEYALLTDLEGYEYAFEKVEKTFLTPPELAGWTLSQEGSSFILSDSDANSTTFSQTSGTNEYLPTSVTQTGGEGNKTQMVYEIVKGNRRLKTIIAPAAAGVTCNESNAKTAAGCRSLTFAYKSATAWGGPEILGDRLNTITYYGPTAANTMSNWTVAQYNYNAEGRLVEEWDPRLSALKEKYAYESGGQLSTITPPGEEPWTLEYGTFEQEQRRRSPGRGQTPEPSERTLSRPDDDLLRRPAERLGGSI